MKKARISKNTLLLLAMVIATMIMGIGYASIESVTGEIEGKVIADAQSGVFIIDAEYVSDIDANTTNCEINNFLDTMLNSTINLSKTNPNSEIKYKVTVHNSSTETVPFVGVVYDNDFYDNTDITFEITQEGFKIGEAIEPNETKEIYITFKYKNATTESVPENTVLKSYLNFKMAEPNRMVVANSGDETTNYLTSSIAKEKIELIKFEQGKEPEYSDKIIARFDASEKQDESIIGYYTDVDNNDLYELTFVSQEIIYANKNARYLFMNLTNVKNIEFYNFSTLGANNMNGMFMGCESLTELNLSNFDTKNVNDITHMFAGCSKLIELNLNNFDTSQVRSMTGTFKNCKELVSLHIQKFNTNNVIKMNNMFYECRKLKELDVSNFDTSQVTNMEAMFYQCNNIEEIDLKHFNISDVKNMSQMFFYCSKIVKLDVSNFDTRNVTDMSQMFGGCSSLIELDLSNFNTKNVKKMQGMFGFCTELKEVKINNFETDNITDMSGMFKGDKNLKMIDISKFNTKQVTNMSQMFSECDNLETIYVSEYDYVKDTGWTIMFVTNSWYMFGASKKIIGGNGTKYNSNYTDATYARIDTEETPGYFTNIKDKPADAEQ